MTTLQERLRMVHKDSSEAEFCAVMRELVPVIASRIDELETQVAALRKTLIDVHNNGANWSGQTTIRTALNAYKTHPCPPTF